MYVKWKWSIRSHRPRSPSTLRGCIRVRLNNMRNWSFILLFVLTSTGLHLTDAQPASRPSRAQFQAATSTLYWSERVVAGDRLSFECSGRFTMDTALAQTIIFEADSKSESFKMFTISTGPTGSVTARVGTLSNKWALPRLPGSTAEVDVTWGGGLEKFKSGGDVRLAWAAWSGGIVACEIEVNGVFKLARLLNPSRAAFADSSSAETGVAISGSAVVGMASGKGVAAAVFVDDIEGYMVSLAAPFGFIGSGIGTLQVDGPAGEHVSELGISPVTLLSGPSRGQWRYQASGAATAAPEQLIWRFDLPDVGFSD